jgi:hypothetical protein
VIEAAPKVIVAAVIVSAVIGVVSPEPSRSILPPIPLVIVRALKSDPVTSILVRSRIPSSLVVKVIVSTAELVDVIAPISSSPPLPAESARV